MMYGVSLEIVFIFTHIVDSDEMPHLDLHYLPKYPFTGIQNENGLKSFCSVNFTHLCHSVP